MYINVSGFSTLIRLIHPVNTASKPFPNPNTASANHRVSKNFEKPLETKAQALHPLQKHQVTPILQPVVSQITEPTTVQKQKPEIQFDSTVGSKNSQRINPFAEQNAKAEAKKAEKTQRRSRNRKTFKIAGLVFGITILAAGITAGIIIWQQKSHTDQPSDAELLEQAEKQKEELVTENGNYVFGSNAATEAQKEVNDIIASGGNPAEIGAFFTDKFSSVTNKAEIVNLTLLEMESYAQISQFEDVIKASQKISTDDMTTFQLVNYYGLLQSAYYAIGDNITAEHYTELFSKAAEAYQSS